MGNRITFRKKQDDRRLAVPPESLADRQAAGEKDEYTPASVHLSADKQTAKQAEKHLDRQAESTTGI